MGKLTFVIIQKLPNLTYVIFGGNVKRNPFNNKRNRYSLINYLLEDERKVLYRSIPLLFYYIESSLKDKN